MTEKINRICPPAVDAGLRLDEILASHTTFAVGGPADIWLSPRRRPSPAGGEELAVNILTPAQDDPLELFLSRLVPLLREEGVPLTLLGGGANVVVSDRGIRGVVLDTAGLDRLVYGTFKADSPLCDRLYLGAGVPVDRAVDDSIRCGLAGLEFLAGMPGTLGGAVWMNARCYGSSIADILVETRYLDEDGSIRVLPFAPGDFDYKKSPFQGTPRFILGAVLRLEAGDSTTLAATAAAHRADRREKGHYTLPCAGSAFKNDRRFGKPSGQIIDEAGLRGLSIGDAQLAPWHGNIIVNRGKATATDIRALAEEVRRRVLALTGFDLECEILFLGDWS